MIAQTEQEFRDCLISLGLMSLARQIRSEEVKLSSDSAEKLMLASKKIYSLQQLEI